MTTGAYTLQWVSSFLTAHQHIIGYEKVDNNRIKLEMWANAQRDGHPAEYRWHPLFNAAKFGWRPILECRAVTMPTRDQLKCAVVPQTRQQISAVSRP